MNVKMDDPIQMREENSVIKHPQLIQGGMGIGVSSWRLARVVSKLGQLGVVSGTGTEFVFARQLQLGDKDGHLRQALENFHDQSIVQRILDRYFIPGGLGPSNPFKNPPIFSIKPTRDLIELTVCANFCQVWLAKHGHAGVVGVNYLEKLQLPLLAGIYGALLASVDYILIGAGIPNQIPAILDRLVNHEDVSYRLYVEGTGSSDDVRMRLSPSRLFSQLPPPLKRPCFLPIVSSNVLAQRMLKAGRIDGFVVEGPCAGGHNAPPRGTLQLNEIGEPVYGIKDGVDYVKMQNLRKPFWIAGTYASPEQMAEALRYGAQGIQVGSIFALCDESGMEENLKRTIRAKGFSGEQEIFTDPYASPTGFPLKIASVARTVSDPEVYQNRERKCDIGRLCQLFVEKGGTIGSRCPGEPVDRYVAKGGRIEDTIGRKCLCNGLLATVGLGQRRRNGFHEPPLVTIGSDLGFLGKLMESESSTYSAERAVRYLMS